MQKITSRIKKQKNIQNVSFRTPLMQIFLLYFASAKYKREKWNS